MKFQYYRMKNIEADTEMRKNIASDGSEVTTSAI